MKLLRAEDDVREMMGYIPYYRALETIKESPYVKIDNCFYLSDVNFYK